MKKVLIAALCVVIMFIPTYIAVAYYNAAQNNPVSESSVIKMQLTDPEGTVYTFDKDTPANDDFINGPMLAFFLDMNSGANEATELPEPLVGSDSFKVVYYSYDKQTEYKYYFTADPNYAYYTDGNTKTYRISPKYAEKFLQSTYALCLYPTSAAPIMTLSGSNVIQPNSISWRYLSYNNIYKETPGISSTDEINSYEVTSSLKIAFDTQPDYLLVNITDTAGNIVFDDLYENMGIDIYSDNARYNVTVTAKWYESEERGSCGEAVYKFIADVRAPAVFYLGESTIDPGEFVVISGKNVVDTSKITFSSNPSIEFTPVFFADGEYVHALVPISMYLAYSPTYTFTVGYGDVVQEMTLNVNNKQFKTQQQNVSATTVTTYRNSTSIKNFETTLSTYLQAKSDTLYWADGSTLGGTVSGSSIRTGYGVTITLTSTMDTYRHEGVNYVVSSGQKVLAAMAGKVIYTGELTLSGKTIIVEHGGGLKTLYAHLSSYDVKIGDVVEKGQKIGVVGSTGFTESTYCYHFGLYVFDVPVCPYDLWENGVAISKIVTQNQ